MPTRFARSIGVAAALFLAACRSQLTPVPSCGPVPCRFEALARAVDSAVQHGAAPGAVVAVSVRGQRFLHATGQIGFEESAPVTRRTVYDLASLTKVIALTTLTMMAVDQGLFRLDDSVSRYLPAFGGGTKSGVTIRHLLTHSSGLPAHRPLWRDAADPAAAMALVLDTPLDTVPGARMVYSDLGAIVLTQIVERAFGQPIDRLFASKVATPLRMTSSRFTPPGRWVKRIAPTERDPWRGRLIRGEVHDENAAFLGGRSGHAGLFSTADDLIGFGEWLLGQRAGRGSTIRTAPRLREAVVLEFTKRQDVVAGSSRALGWDTPAPGNSAGTRVSAEGFGHTGFTGTSIWLDPSRDLVIVLLTNRVNPTRDNTRLTPLRPLVANLAVESIENGAR
ncbi:MAG: class A beta-lactamase-related serine hydrolase [Gemmatimonadetes bacterium]|nr:class A beta-lactamase-related serine hydrolase [Gemmatimonadota bacterium]